MRKSRVETVCTRVETGHTLENVETMLVVFVFTSVFLFLFPLLPNMAFNLVNILINNERRDSPYMQTRISPHEHLPLKTRNHQIRYHTTSSVSVPFTFPRMIDASRQSTDQNQGGASPFREVSAWPSTCFSRLATMEPLPSDAPLTSCLSGLRPADVPTDLGRKGTGVVGREERNCTEC